VAGYVECASAGAAAERFRCGYRGCGRVHHECERDGSEAMFTTMCALLAAGFESDVSAVNWHPLRAQLRERMSTSRVGSGRPARVL